MENLNETISSKIETSGEEYVISSLLDNMKSRIHSFVERNRLDPNEVVVSPIVYTLLFKNRIKFDCYTLSPRNFDKDDRKPYFGEVFGLKILVSTMLEQGDFFVCLTDR
jgi:hypothetical protein